MAFRVAVAVSGRGSNLEALCKQLAHSSEVELVLVLSDREAPALALARAYGIPTHQLYDYRSAVEWEMVLTGAQVDLLVLAGYLKLIPREVVVAFRGRIINIHPALLPRHGGPGMYGRRVHEAVLASGDAESGATVHAIDEFYDQGEILGQARLLIEPGEEPAHLAARVLELEHQVLPAAVLAAARAGHPVPLPAPFAPIDISAGEVS